MVHPDSSETACVGNSQVDRTGVAEVEWTTKGALTRRERHQDVSVGVAKEGRHSQPDCLIRGGNETQQVDD